MTALNQTETEVVVLKAVNELIDSIVNLEVLEKFDASSPTNVMFRTATHAKFFNIVLVDLLSMTDKKGLIKPEPYLALLKAISENPQFNANDSVALLRDTTSRFTTWLRTPITIEKVWLPSVSIETDLKLDRFDVIKNAGNICRHNFLRAIGIAEDVRKILASNNISIDTDQALLVLADLYEWFHTHVFHYHSSTIAEFLNDIRWGIHQYLLPQYQKSIVFEGGNPPKYRYTNPMSLNSEFAKECYWSLMNDVRGTPYIKRFQVHDILKKRY